MADLFTTNNIDFESIKESLRNHLRTTDTFKDYNFEGSALAMIIDILAYNTQYQAFYNNMVINEMFIDTAVASESINSIAKSLGYRPSSITAAMAEVDITLSNKSDYPVGSFLPANTQFTATRSGQSFTFQTIDTTLVTSDDAPQLSGVKIYEGTLQTSQFVYDESNDNSRYTIPEKNVDITTIKVNVQKSVGDNEGYSDNWSLSDSLLSIDSEDKVYFIQKNREGRYEIYFGDGLVGKSLDHGNLIYISYLITSGEPANGVGEGDTSTNRVFTSASLSNDIAVTSVAQGGSPPESIESVRTNAPLAYQAQNRAVTTTDYKAIIQEQFPSLESVSVYGGEDEDPPQYGRVMIAVKPFSGKFLTDATKDSIGEFIKGAKGVIGISPIVTDAEYLYLRLDVDVKYQSTKTGVDKDAIRTAINVLLTNHIDLNLEKFNQNLYLSRLQTLVDKTDSSIVGNSIDITLEKRLIPNLASAITYSTSFANPIHNPHVGHIPVISSRSFTFIDDNGSPKTGSLVDNSEGKLRIVDKAGESLKENAGTVNYDTGHLTLRRIRITAVDGNAAYLDIQAKPRNNDILAPRDTIITYDASDPMVVQVSMVDMDNVENNG
jgi:hypothetical protein